MVSFRLLFSGLLGAACLVPLAGCKEPPPPPEVIRPVRAVRLNDAAAFDSGYLPGRAKATQEVDLAFRVAGPLIDFPVDLGTRVEAGDVVAQIDPRPFEYEVQRTKADLAAAEAELDAMNIGAREEEIIQLKAALRKAEAQEYTAKRELERATPLVESRTISESDFDRYKEAVSLAEAEVEQAKEELRIGEEGARAEDIKAKESQIKSLESRLELAKDDVDYTKLKAPFTGTVVAKYVENYEDVRAKERIVRIVDTSRIEIIVNVPEGSISLVPRVTDITCTFDALPDRPLPATVKEIGVEATRSTRTYPVTLIMDQPDDVEILPGMTGRVKGKIKAETEDGHTLIEVPETAVFEGEGKKSFVWIIESSDGKTGTAKLREVVVNQLTARGLQIASGLDAQDIVATAGVYEIKEGQEVRLLLTPYEVAVQ